MEEALAGLHGIKSLEVDLEHDLFHIAYDSGRVAPADMLRAIHNQKFEGKVVETGKPVAARPTRQRLDVSRLPEDLRRTVEEAKRRQKLLLFAFTGPG